MSTRAPAADETALTRRTRARVEGTVQGVGFRPFVYRLADEHGLTGFVLNDSHGVLLEVEGSAGAVEEFLARLARDAPPLAVIERISAEERELQGDSAFAILDSPPSGVIDVPVAPDSATCADCRRELFDPEDRRYRYPFINCTNCGPRFTIVRGIPYDRPFTTMASFAMCERCRAEYEDPVDRRFHAQPNACPECGPSVSLLRTGAMPADLGPDCDAVSAAAEALGEGQIVAVKGIGGFHLACRADDESAVAALRARKHREDKPFALMVATTEVARRLVRLGELESTLLGGPERPIVLLPRLGDAAVAPSVAPGALELGVMLPYSPLHHLLFADLAEGTALVMTSGNVSDEPIAFRDDDALMRLSEIADLLLVHNRPIQTRTDDSVLRVLDTPGAPRTLPLRRSRGYVPASLPLPHGAEHQILACGAELKNTFCLSKGPRAWVSHHIGDLENYETLSSFTEGIEHFTHLFGVEPDVVAHDLHPEYLSTKYAMDQESEELIGVQHHHAHLAACLAEHGEPRSAVGAVFDGSGYGLDGTVWGGELLVGDLEDFRRVGMLLPVRLPGGARAIREPWRMACAWLSLLGESEDLERAPDIPPALRGVVHEVTWQQVSQLSRSGVQSPVTTSMGRLFDAVAALCGLRARVNYEGQAAIELEAACDASERGSYPISLLQDNELTVIDPRETIHAVRADLQAGAALGAVASRFHAALSAATVTALAQAASVEGSELIVLSGGVFQNRRLLEAVIAGLDAAGLRVITPERLPPGDGGISYGQAAIAARRMALSPKSGAPMS
ncbi:MAG TPA: carbamoyltransferase HypF [Solirubrobacteraceae bacterium]|jgi:hydrogenase maturation protein HypF|nr:carbamoyltransferase HypF [Solirubrobacteraceae bacterium]